MYITHLLNIYTFTFLILSRIAIILMFRIIFPFGCTFHIDYLNLLLLIPDPNIIICFTKTVLLHEEDGRMKDVNNIRWEVHAVYFHRSGVLIVWIAVSPVHCKYWDLQLATDRWPVNLFAGGDRFRAAARFTGTKIDGTHLRHGSET